MTANHMRATSPPFALLVIAIAVAGCAGFTPIPPNAMKKAGDFTPVVHELPVHETLRYGGSWNGIPAGIADFTFTRDDGTYVSRAHLQTTGLASLLYGVSVSAKATSRTKDLLSERWSYRTSEKKVEVTFDPSKGTVSATVEKDGKAKMSTFEAKGCLDPIGAVYALRRSDLSPGRSYEQHLFPEHNLYQIRAFVLKKRRIEVEAGTFETVEVRVEIRKIEHGKPAKSGRDAAFWITTDADRIPVRIDADTKIGRVSLQLESYEEGGS